MTFFNKMTPNDIIAVAVYLEGRKTRTYVGELLCLKVGKNLAYQFSYDKKYLYNKTAIPLGPELALTKKIHQSTKLFKSLENRIPSKSNPAYVDYCRQMNISPQENNKIILLATIGKRGPSSFVFEPVFDTEFTGADAKLFRKELGLTTREFAKLFEISHASVIRIENGTVSGKELLKRIEIYKKFPQVTLFELERRGGVLHTNKKIQLYKKLSKVQL